MLLNIIDGGEDPDEVFSDFEDDKYGIGTGGAVAEVLSKEFGMYFYYYQGNPDDEECSQPCIMTEDEEFTRSGMQKSMFLLRLQQAAAALQIPQFGHIFFSCLASSQVKLYDTNTFGYEFNGSGQ